MSLSNSSIIVPSPQVPDTPSGNVLTAVPLRGEVIVGAFCGAFAGIVPESDTELFCGAGLEAKLDHDVPASKIPTIIMKKMRLGNDVWWRGSILPVWR